MNRSDINYWLSFNAAQRAYDNQLPPEDPEPSAWAMDRATEILIENGTFFEWLSPLGEVREPSKFFGPISMDELMLLLVNPDNTPEQCKAIGEIVRQRFIDENLERITEKAFAIDEQRREDEACGAAEHYWNTRQGN